MGVDKRRARGNKPYRRGDEIKRRLNFKRLPFNISKLKGKKGYISVRNLEIPESLIYNFKQLTVTKKNYEHIYYIIDTINDAINAGKLRVEKCSLCSQARKFWWIYGVITA